MIAKEQYIVHASIQCLHKNAMLISVVQNRQLIELSLTASFSNPSVLRLEQEGVIPWWLKQSKKQRGWSECWVPTLTQKLGVT